MRLDLRIVALLGLLATPAWAVDQLGFAGVNPPQTAVTTYAFNQANGSSPDDRAGVVSYSFTAQNLYCRATAAPDFDVPGSGTSWTITVQRSTFAAPTTWLDAGSPAISCVIGDGQTSCNDLTHTQAFGAGDSIVFKIVGAGDPYNFSRLSCTVGGGASITLGVSNFSAPTFSSVVWGMWSNNGSTFDYRFPTAIPTAVTVSKLYCVSNNAPTSGKSYAIKVLQAFNGDINNFASVSPASDTGITCTMSDAATTCSDTTHSSGFSVNDHIVYQITPSGSPSGSAKIRCGLVGS